MSERELTGEMIREAMLRAEKAACPPADPRCYGFPWGVEEALKTRSPAGWCLTGWPAADGGRMTWDGWDTVRTGEGRLKHGADGA